MELKLIKLKMLCLVVIEPGTPGLGTSSVHSHPFPTELSWKVLIGRYLT